MSYALKAPPLLTPGETIALVAPAGSVNRDALKPCLALLQKRYRVLCRDDMSDPYHYLAGQDARRLTELQDAINHPQVKAIIAVRGGFGSIRILDRLHTDRLQHHPKWLVGYSDITALHAKWACEGLQSIHAPMALELPNLPPSDLETWFKMLEGDTPIHLQGSHVLSHGKAIGPLMGGNLATLASLIGTPMFPPIQGAVLLLEDVDESPYRIDRMLMQLRLAGVFGQVAAIALGSWANCLPRNDGTTIDQVLADTFTDASFPVLAGLPVGHVTPNIPLPLGHLVQIDTATQQLTDVE